MKKFFLLFAILSCTVAATAVPTYDLNGGVMPTGVPADNATLWSACMPACRNYYGTSRADQLLSGNGVATFFYGTVKGFLTSLTGGKLGTTQEPWIWLGEYMICCVPGLASLSDGDSWGYSTQLFFKSAAASEYGEKRYATGQDWTTVGKPKYWQLAYMIGNNLFPQREGYHFVGWNTQSNGSGTAVKSVSELKNLSGTVYAVWVKFDWNGGGLNFTEFANEGDYNFSSLSQSKLTYVDGGQMTNELLWESFKYEYINYYALEYSTRTRADQQISDVATYMEKGQDMMTNTTSFKWLGDYIKSYTGTMGHKIDTEVLWRYGVSAFFNKKVANPSTFNGSANFQSAGTPAAWLPYYYFAANPVKTVNGKNVEFLGWYSGNTKYTTLAAALQAGVNTLTAKWKGAITMTHDLTLILDNLGDYNYEENRDDNPETSKSVGYNASVEGATSVVEWTLLDENGTPIEPSKYPLTLTVSGTYYENVKITRNTSNLLGGKMKLQAKTTDGSIECSDVFWVPTLPKAENATNKKYVYAYDVRAKYDPVGKRYDFIFKPNAKATSGNIHLTITTDKTKQHSVPFTGGDGLLEPNIDAIVSVPEGVIINELKIENITLNTSIQWEVELTAEEVTDFSYVRKGQIQGGKTGVIAVNKAPTTPNFGYAYTYFIPKESTANIQGSYVFSADLSRKENVLGPQGFTFGRIARLAIDSHGDVYFTDKSHTNPGVFVGRVNEYHPERMPIYPFFLNENETDPTTGTMKPLAPVDPDPTVNAPFEGTDALTPVDGFDELGGMDKDYAKYWTADDKDFTSNVKVSDGDDYSEIEPSQHIYPILRHTVEEDGKSIEREIGSAIMAVDTYIKNGKAILFCYAKGHSKQWGANKHKDVSMEPYITNGEWHKRDRNQYTIIEARKDVEEKYIPYHSILEYELGKVGCPLDTSWNVSKKSPIIRPIWSHHHQAQTGNIWATQKGLWIGHYRARTQNSTWAASLMFQNANETANGYGVYNSGEYNTDEINGSEGGAFAVNDENTLLILQNATKQLLVYAITWDGTTPKLNLVNVYEHDLGSFNQMNFDYAGNLFCAGPDGLTVLTIPEVGQYKGKVGETAGNEYETLTGKAHGVNTSIVPARERYKLSPELYYDHIFTNAKGNETNAADAVKNNWHTSGNWNWDVVPGSESNVRIDEDVRVNESAEVGSIDFNHWTDSDEKEHKPTLVVEPGGSLYYTGYNLTAAPSESTNSDEVILTTGIKNYDRKPVEVKGGTPVDENFKKYAPIDEATDLQHDKHAYITLEQAANGKGMGELLHSIQAEAPVPATAKLEASAKITPTTADWQYIAVPFGYKDATEILMSTWMYGWSEAAHDWSVIAGWGNELKRFNGYLLSHDESDLGRIHSFKGNFNVAQDSEKTKYDPQTGEMTLDLSYTASATEKDDNDYTNVNNKYLVQGWNYIGNSWTATLYVDNFRDTDFSGSVEKTVYVYGDRGKDGQGNKLVGDYKELPVKQVMAYNEKIAPLQAFFVKANAVGGKLILDYDRLTDPYYLDANDNTRPEQTTSEKPALRARRRVEIVQDKLYLTISGDKNDVDELYLFEADQYTEAFDNGYEASKMEGDAGSPYLAATTSLGEMAVVASPEIAGTVLNFRKGMSTDYTFTFTYDGTDDLYLEDNQTGTLTSIYTGGTYNFTASEDDSQRFRIVRKRESTDVATGVVSIWATDYSLYMNNPAGELLDVSVYAADGQLVLHKETRESVTSLEVPMHGVYTIQVKTDDNVQTIKHIL